MNSFIAVDTIQLPLLPRNCFENQYLSQCSNAISPFGSSSNGSARILSVDVSIFFSFPPQGKSANDLKAWDAAIERAKANLAHQMLRNTNADLQLRHASNAHKVPPLIAASSSVAQCNAGPQFCSRGAASQRAGASPLLRPTESFVFARRSVPLICCA